MFQHAQEVGAAHALKVEVVQVARTGAPVAAALVRLASSTVVAGVASKMASALVGHHLHRRHLQAPEVVAP